MKLSGVAREHVERATGIALALAPGAAYLILVWDAFAFDKRGFPLPSAVCWALAILISCGYAGAAIVAWLHPRDRFDWGLRSALGLAAYVLLGGVAAMLHVMSVPLRSVSSPWGQRSRRRLTRSITARTCAGHARTGDARSPSARARHA